MCSLWVSAGACVDPEQLEARKHKMVPKLGWERVRPTLRWPLSSLGLWFRIHSDSWKDTTCSKTMERQARVPDSSVWTSLWNGGRVEAGFPMLERPWPGQPGESHPRVSVVSNKEKVHKSSCKLCSALLLFCLSVSVGISPPLET